MTHLEYFYEISKIPRPSGEEEKIADYLCEFAEKHGCILVLKGAATIVTDGSLTYINSSGSSALAKAGSGDVLAGLMTSLLSFAEDELEAAALAVYLHGAAGDKMAEQFSEFGVTPSDLPKECARIISSLTK